ncbi:hypothetical protein [Rickettsia endosymbiont of Nabis limbatus]
MFRHENNTLFLDNLNEREINQVLELLGSHPEINELTRHRQVK